MKRRIRQSLSSISVDLRYEARLQTQHCTEGAADVSPEWRPRATQSSVGSARQVDSFEGGLERRTLKSEYCANGTGIDGSLKSPIPTRPRNRKGTCV